MPYTFGNVKKRIKYGESLYVVMNVIVLLVDNSYTNNHSKLTRKFAYVAKKEQNVAAMRLYKGFVVTLQ